MQCCFQLTGDTRASIRQSNMSQICAMGFKFGLMTGQGTDVLVVGGYCSWTMKPGRCHLYTQAMYLVRGCWNVGQQLVARRLWCADLQLGCLVWWLNLACSNERYTQNHYWASTVRNSWLDVPWGIGCNFVSPNPHPAVDYMKQKPALVWLMDLAPCPSDIRLCTMLTENE